MLFLLIIFLKGQLTSTPKAINALTMCVYVRVRCWSSLGRQSRGQLVSLRKNGCVYTGTVQHEVLHALGFHHEHVRSDRDSYVRILTDNIQSGQLNHMKTL